MSWALVDDRHGIGTQPESVKGSPSAAHSVARPASWFPSMGFDKGVIMENPTQWRLYEFPTIIYCNNIILVKIMWGGP